jgi:hypothetical protein
MYEHMIVMKFYASKNEMKILYIWDADYPWDVKVEMICTSLMKNDNEVYIAARNLKKLPEYENMDGLHVYRLKKKGRARCSCNSNMGCQNTRHWFRFCTHIPGGKCGDCAVRA